jgi:SecD/SecF fusion protein
MNGTTLFRLALTVLVGLWAASELTPPFDQPFEEYVLTRVTAQPAADGAVARSREENLGAFGELMQRARDRMAATAGQPANPYSTLFAALLRISNDENIDLSQYFGDIRIRDTNNLKKKNRILLTELLQRSKGEVRFGLDLNGGVALTFVVDEAGLSDDIFFRQRQLDDARRVIADRVDGLGVAEPVVRVKGTNMIEVQMPGVSSRDNPNIAETIGAPALLEFKQVHRTAQPGPGVPTPLGFEIKVQQSEEDFTGNVREDALFVSRFPMMTGDIISQARPQITSSGGYEVTMDFTSVGRRQFADATGQIAAENNDFNVGRLAIVLDGKLISSPTVRERIDSSSARITGSFTQREAFELANALNNPLAVSLQVAEMYEVGPTLARDARDASLNAAMWTGAAVVGFMILYYGLAGVFSMIAVVLNVFLVLGALSSFGATLTLPGVAALVLTIGMAVDASILIFERVREELKAGKTLASSFQNGFDKALSTIVDANVTTLLTALVLIWLGTGPVKGFGVTLAAGIVATVFCALVMLRWMIDLALHYGVIRKAFSFQLFRDTRFAFLNHARKAFAFSWVLVILATISFAFHINNAFGIDFTGGDEVTANYDQRLTSQQVQAVAASSQFVDKDGDAQPFGEVNILFQTPIGADQEIMVVQTQPGKGVQFFEQLVAAYPDAGLVKVGETQIGSAVGSEVTRSAILSILISLIAILFYIALRFEFGFGLGAVVATVHDVLMTIGVFVMLGELLGIGSGQFTAPMIAAILMTVGYSINDTIVVFDRIREELQLNPTLTLKDVIHLSINRVLNRTILTSLTTLFASLALFLFGAGVILDFALVFMIGVLTGTFSSMFIASPVFFWYHKGDRRHVEKGEILPSYDWTAEPTPRKQGTTQA